MYDMMLRGVLIRFGLTLINVSDEYGHFIKYILKYENIRSHLIIFDGERFIENITFFIYDPNN